MSIDFASRLISEALMETLLISAPMLGLGLLVGLLISIFQATTQIQEQTMTFVPKIVVVLGSIIVFGNWIITSIVNFTMRLFELIPGMVR